MKKLFLIFIFLSCNTIFSQEDVKASPFSTFKIGVYGGINFVESSDGGGDFLLEGKTDLLKNCNLKLSAGYYKVFEPVNYTVRGYGTMIIGGDVISHYGASYETIIHIYAVFPFSIGFEYLINLETSIAYIAVDGSYNALSPSIERTGGAVIGFGSPEEIPDIYKNNEPVIFPTSSFGLALTAGIMFNLTKNLSMDFRYYYKIDNEIANTHHFLVGIVF